jgi:hypothetical protein
VQNIINTAKSHKLVILHEPSDEIGFGDLSGENTDYKENVFSNILNTRNSISQRTEIKWPAKVRGTAKRKTGKGKQIKSGNKKKMPIWKNVSLGPKLGQESNIKNTAS